MYESHNPWNKVAPLTVLASYFRGIVLGAERESAQGAGSLVLHRFVLFKFVSDVLYIIKERGEILARVPRNSEKMNISRMRMYIYIYTYIHAYVFKIELLS